MSRLPAWIGQHLAAVRAIIVLTIITGVAYPLVIMGIGQVAFRQQANGSPVLYHGKTVGSSLLCQEFTGVRGNPLPRYFQPRPSAGSCDPDSSGATSLGPDNPVLVRDIQRRKAAYARLNGVPESSVPPDAVTASGSGLDPDISPANAADQAGRVAAARHLPLATVRSLVAKNTSGRPLGFLGEPGVNVLTLNIALDRLGSGAG